MSRAKGGQRQPSALVLTFAAVGSGFTLLLLLAGAVSIRRRRKSSRRLDDDDDDDGGGWGALLAEVCKYGRKCLAGLYSMGCID